MRVRFGALPETARPAFVETLVQFAVAMLILAVTRLYALHVDARLADVAIQFQGDIAILVLLVAVISLPMLVGRCPPRWLIRGLFLAINLLQIGQAQYLLVTGSYASPALLHYAVLNPGDVAGAASTAINLFTPIMAVVAGVLVFFGGYPVGRLTEHPLSRRWAPLFTLFFFAACLWSIDGFSNVRNPGAISNALGIADFRRIDLPVVLDPLPGYAAPTMVSGPTRKPDVVLLILESTRADAIEGESPGMPYLAELAKGSRSFERAYTTTSHTSKALVGIHCGTYPRPELTITENQPGGLPLTCLPKILGDLGYYTAYLQSADGSFENRYGLVENLGYSLFRPREKLDPGFKEAGYLGKDEFAMLGPAREAARAAGSRPLLLTVLTSVTHYPYVLPGTITKRYSARSADPMSAYRRTLAHADAFVREFVATLSRERDMNNTLLIVVSDHGEAFGEHGFYVHDEAMYEEVVRGLMMVRYPGVVPPGRDVALRQGIDILPTVLDLLGATWEGQLPGLSLLNEQGHQAVVTSCWNNNACQAAVASDGLKLIHYHNGHPPSLFDLQSDPLETHNLISDPHHADRVVDLLMLISRQRDLNRRTYPAQ